MNSKLIEYFNGDTLAASVWQGKYQYKDEETPDDMHKRLAKAFALIEEEYQAKEAKLVALDGALSKYGTKRKWLTYETIYKLFKDFKYIIPQGSIMSQLGTDSIGSLSNCFVIGQPQDSYGGILQKDQELVQLMKRRGGVGLDLSTLRPKGTKTTNAAKSSTGPISFMPRYSNSTREVAQDGRRGALMLSLDVKHPDILDFIRIKRDLTQITGANISIKLFDDFMNAVINNENYILRWPCSKMIDHAIHTKEIKAKEYWNEIIKSAHNVAEPGLMFWDNMVDYSPDGIYIQYRQITTNPCSEIAMQPYDACRLIAVNLFSFVDKPFTKAATFNYEKFGKINYEAMRLSDDLIDLEIANINRILKKIKNDPESTSIKLLEYSLWEKVKKTASASRRTGLGFTALGDTLAALGLKYDSEKALHTVKRIMKTKMQSELDCTTDLAILRGTFEGWDWSKEFFHTMGKNQSKHEFRGNNNFYQFLVDKFPEQAYRMLEYGRRNVSWSTVAPTGTVSLMTQTTSGIEPLFMPYYIRRKKVNPNDKDVRVDFTDQNGDTWMEYPVLHPKFKDWLILQIDDAFDYEEKVEMINSMNQEQLKNWFEESPWYGSTANDIDWIKRVEIQSVIQKYITHSISSTINLPSTVSEEEVSKIYLEAWKKGLKGITVYRDGSRSGVLVSNKSNEFEYKDAPKRPKNLKAEGHTTVVKGEKFNVIVGLLDDKPYEVFMFPFVRDLGHGTLGKIKGGVYDYQDTDKNLVIQGLSTRMTDEQTAITRLVSTSLRHGANIKFIVEQLNKSEGDLFSFTKGLARVIKKYIPDGSLSTTHCKDCGSENVIFEEGCQMCKDCGSSKCG